MNTPSDSRQSLRVRRPRNCAQVVAVAAGKGGVGKSTVTAALALELRHRGMRVGILDADIFGPSCPALFDAHTMELENIDAQRIAPARLANGIQLVSFGLILGESPAIMRGPMVSQYMRQLLLDVEWDALDILLIDLPPGTGDIHLTVTQEIMIDGGVIVSTPQTLSYSDVGKAILMFEKVAVRIVGIVENMSWLTCTSCGEPMELQAAGHNSTEWLSERFGVPVIARFPFDAAKFSPPLTYSDDAQPLADAVMASLAEPPPSPPKVLLQDAHLVIDWTEGGRTRVPYRELRASCQCALCVDTITKKRAPHAPSIPPDVRAVEVQPLGNYALYIRWSDGHATGFFPYRQIKKLESSLQ